MRTVIVRGALAVILGLVTVLARVGPAEAVHLFPLTPFFDPLGHDCAKNLTPDPGTAAGRVSVIGFNFIDSVTGTSTTAIAAGQSVTWKWLADHCHSVTFVPTAGAPQGTQGAPGFQPAQPELVRIGSGDTFTATFSRPGTYAYFCVHHQRVGMTGTVVVA